MKQFNILTIFAIALFLSINFSCKKDDDNNGTNIGSDGCVATWKVDGVEYSQTDLQGCLWLDNILNIATNVSGGNFFLQIDPITTTGTYVADPTNQDLSVVIFMDLTDGTRIGISDGSVEVSELSSSKAKGTFSGNFYDLTNLSQTPTFSVTEGTFEVDF